MVGLYSSMTSKLADLAISFEKARNVLNGRPKSSTFDGDPMGVQSYLTNQYNKRFRVHVMHTNFPLTEEIVELVATTPGVEVVRPLTPYRISIGFGHLFDHEEVQAAIRKRISECKANKIQTITAINSFLPKSLSNNDLQ